MMPGDPVVGSTVLRRPAIQSPNYVQGSTGWSVNADGSAEFNNLTIRGTFLGIDFILNTTGLFLYSGTPALGNLSASIVPGTAAVTDPEGNTAQPGFTSYASSTFWAQLLAGVLNFATTGTFTNASFGSNVPGAAYMSSGAAISGDGIAEVLAEATSTSGLGGRLVELIAEYVQMGVGGTGTVTILNNCTINGTLSVGGSTSTGTPSNNSTSTNGLTNGTINGTSGAASAGTAHTHGAGSYAVNNGQHAHNLNSHAHPL
jgi:hypothetical protein